MKHARNLLVAAVVVSSGACTMEKKAGAPDSASGAAASKVEVNTADARQLVQGFYDWYAPLAVAMSKETGAARAARGFAAWQAMQGHSLAPDLVDGLRADSLLRTDRSREHDLLEGDPFLWSQDPCAPYDVTAVDGQGVRALVTVTATCARGSTPPTPVIEVKRGAAGLEITNVYYYDTLNRTGELCRNARQLPASQRPRGC